MRLGFTEHSRAEPLRGISAQRHFPRRTHFAARKPFLGDQVDNVTGNGVCSCSARSNRGRAPLLGNFGSWLRFLNALRCHRMAEPAPRFVRAWTLRMVWRQGSEADWN